MVNFHVSRVMENGLFPSMDEGLQGIRYRVDFNKVSLYYQIQWRGGIRVHAALN